MVKMRPNIQDMIILFMIVEIATFHNPKKVEIMRSTVS